MRLLIKVNTIIEKIYISKRFNILILYEMFIKKSEKKIYFLIKYNIWKILIIILYIDILINRNISN